MLAGIPKNSVNEMGQFKMGTQHASISLIFPTLPLGIWYPILFFFFALILLLFLPKEKKLEYE